MPHSNVEVNYSERRNAIKALQKSDNEAAQLSEFFRILSIPGM